MGTLSRGSNTIVLSVGFSGQSYTENWGVWIDFNQNGTFETSEKVVTGSTSSSGNLSYNFTVPSGALTGKTRMRVAMKWNGIPTPCETFSYGEVEDYAIAISSDRTAIASDYRIDGQLGVESSVFDAQLIQRDEVLTIQMKDNREVAYALYNVLGQQITEGAFKGTTEVTDIPKGVYFINIQDDQRTINQKFIKR